MYWTDWGNSPKIERAWMNGEEREVKLSLIHLFTQSFIFPFIHSFIYSLIMLTATFFGGWGAGICGGCYIHSIYDGNINLLYQ